MPAGFSSADVYYLLPELLVTAGAVIVLIADMLVPRPVRRGVEQPSVTDLALAAVTIASLACAGVAVLFTAGTHVSVARGLLAVDGLALLFKLLFLVAAVLTVLMSTRYLAVERVHAGEYYFLVLCATVGMMILASAIDLITIFVGLETMAVSFYVLTGLIRPNRRSNEAAMKYFVLGAFSLAILLYGMSFLYGLTGTTHLRDIATALLTADTGRLLPLAVLLVVAGIGFKIAAVPFHMWAPDVYEGAPTPVAAFLSVGSKAASFAMLLRIFVEGLPAFRTGGLGAAFGQPLGWQAFFYVLAVASMIVGNLAALTQTNTKRLLAYSSIAQAGYVLIGITVGPPRGTAAALVYLIAYSFMQLGAFAVLVALRRRDVAGDEVRDLAGLSKTHPGLAFAMLVFLLSLGGIPPTAGFMGKLWLFGAAIDAGYVGLAVIGVLNSALSLYYYARIVVAMWITDEHPVDPVPRPSPALATVVIFTALATIGLGIYPRLLFELVGGG